jgi:hypothetical protein
MARKKADDAGQMGLNDTQGGQDAGQAEGRVFANVNQALKYVAGELGYQVTFNTLKKHLVGENPPRAPHRRGGGWTAGTLATYAAAHLTPKVDPAAAADAPVKPGKPAAASGGDDEPGAAEARTRAHADKLKIQTERERMKLAQEQGLLVETATVERELADRAKAFRLGLIGYAPRLIEDLSACFGGSRSVAIELCRILEVDEAKAPLIMDFAQSRAQDFGRAWPDKVDDFLDPYSTDAWWTDAMREAWTKIHGGAAAPLAEGAAESAGDEEESPMMEPGS